MKKILIALPLVLIMLLTMIPVSAEDKVTVTINGIKYLDNVKGGKEIKSVGKYTIKNVDSKVAMDAEKLEKLIKEDAKANFTEPKLETKESFNWIYEVKDLQVLVDNKATVQVVEEDLAADKQIKVLKTDIAEYINLDLGTLTDTDKLTDKGLAKINDKIRELVGKEEIKPLALKLEAEDVQKENATAARKILKPVLTAANSKDASASIEVYPDRVTEPKKTEKEEKVCRTDCEQIILKGKDVFTDKIVEELQFKYNTTKTGQIPDYSFAIQHFTQAAARAGYKVLTLWNGSPAINYPETIYNCEIIINIIKMRQEVTVIHELFDCCTDAAGNTTVADYPTKAFIEENTSVDFVEFHSQLIILEDKLKEWAKTRLQMVDSGEYVFLSAHFQDVVNPGKYLNGEVFRMDGTPVKIITAFENRRIITGPTIIIKYVAANCATRMNEEEEQVDNATVENNNTTAPVTANGGANLPATGAKDVSAFFLSAVALLGLGIFFAKKH